MYLGQPVIDCDIHNAVPSVEALFPYLSEHWREYIRTSPFTGPIETPYPPRGGNRRCRPCSEAGSRWELLPSREVGDSPGSPPAGSGWPSCYIEECVAMAQILQTQVLNMIVEGIFDRFANLRVALIEGGWTW